MPARSHSEMLTRIRRIRAAADDEDPERMRGEIHRLIDEYRALTEAERTLIDRLPTVDAQVVRRGQQSILDDLTRISLEADAAGPCDCLHLGADLAALFALQQDAERRAFGRIEV